MLQSVHKLATHVICIYTTYNINCGSCAQQKYWPCDIRSDVHRHYVQLIVLFRKLQSSYTSMNDT